MATHTCSKALDHMKAFSNKEQLNEALRLTDPEDQLCYYVLHIKGGIIGMAVTHGTEKFKYFVGAPA